MTVSESQFDQLVALGRRMGTLTTDDLKRVLPVEVMSPNDLANVIARLEEMDIPVEVDASLLTPGRPNPALDTSAAVLPPERPAERPAARTVPSSSSASAASASTPDEGQARPVAERYRAVRPILPIVAGIALVLLILALWWYLA